MPDWLYITLLFGIGPVMALGIVGLFWWNRRREDREAWWRGQALRRQLREQSAARNAGVAASTAVEPHPCRWFNGKCIDCGRSWGAPRGVEVPRNG